MEEIPERPTVEKKKRSLFDVFSLLADIATLGAVIIGIITLFETKSEFKKINQPFLQLDKISIKPYKVGDTFYIRYSITNLESHPIKIVGQTTGYINRISPPDFDLAISKMPDLTYNINQYVIKETPRNTFIELFKITAQDSVDAYKSNFSTYWLGKITYTDLVSNTTRIYKYEIKFRTVPNGFVPYEYEFVLNENMEKD